uniref:USP8_dimer domain-containing protein n=1 Tax=Panagrellus redivivus TaxID=6233 RepID=A0A7E4W8J8_PANRE
MKPQTSNPVDRFRKIIPPCRYYKLKMPLDKVLQKLDTFYSLGVAYHEGNQLEKAYAYFFRFVDAVVDKLPKHPNYNALTNAYKEELCRRTIRSISTAEKLKAEILSKYCKEAEVTSDTGLRM